jgi:hypothetical protein
VNFQELAMTPTFSLMLAALVLPGFDNTAQAAEEAPASIRESEAQFSSVREAREAVGRVLRASNRASGRDAQVTVPSVISTYRQVARSERIPAADRRLLLGRLQSRLTEQERALRRQEQQGFTSLSGGVATNAQELIDLIQSTVAPDTWAIYGGQGTICYFPNR